MNGEAVYGNYYALREADSDTPVGDVCRQLGVSETSFYLWRKRLREGLAHRDSGDAATAPGEHSSDAADCASHPAQTYIERSRNRALRALRRTLTCCILSSRRMANLLGSIEPLRFRSRSMEFRSRSHRRSVSRSARNRGNPATLPDIARSVRRLSHQPVCRSLQCRCFNHFLPRLMSFRAR
jgi:transposase-like protein